MEHNRKTHAGLHFAPIPFHQTACMRICPIFIHIQICIYSDANVKKCTWRRCIRMHKNKIKLHKHSTANMHMCVCTRAVSTLLLYSCLMNVVQHILHMIWHDFYREFQDYS